MGVLRNRIMSSDNRNRVQTQTHTRRLPHRVLVTGSVFVTLFLLLMWYGTAMTAETGDHKITGGTTGGFVMVKADDPWQPEGFAGAHALRAVYTEEIPAIDGEADDPG